MGVGASTRVNARARWRAIPSHMDARPSGFAEDSAQHPGPAGRLRFQDIAAGAQGPGEPLLLIGRLFTAGAYTRIESTC